MALHGAEILALAQEKGCDVFYEASVAGGIPIIRTLVEGFASERITKIMGIVNGTTNYILTKMSQEGASYEDVLKEAQELGYAESDPTSDVEGLDAARKMTILATLGFNVNVALTDVSVKGISSITKEEILYGKQLGYEIKLLGIAERQDDLISVSVQPTMVKKSHPLASVNGVFNAVYVYGEAVGETMFYGPGAGELPTATSVVADLVAVSRNMGLGVSGRRVFTPYKEKKLKTDEQIASKYFLLLHVADKAGVLAQITQVFAEFDVSLESVLQHPNAANPNAEIIIITHDANQAAMKRVLNRFDSLDVVHEIKSVYRVEG
jgi:homoserine dehydrogenase